MAINVKNTIAKCEKAEIFINENHVLQNPVFYSVTANGENVIFKNYENAARFYNSFVVDCEAIPLF